jgi:hypothetical protein
MATGLKGKFCRLAKSSKRGGASPRTAGGAAYLICTLFIAASDAEEPPEDHTACLK